MFRYFVVASALCFAGLQNPVVAQDSAVRLGRTLTEASRLEKEGKLQPALEGYKECLSLAQQLFGRNHTNCAALLKSIGDVHRKMGDYAAAEPYLREGLSISQSNNDRALALEMMTSLASGYLEQGQYAESRKLSLECLQIVEQVYGKNSTQTATVLGNVAGVFSALGDHEQAERAYGRAITMLEGRAGHEAALSLNLMNIATLYTDRGDYTRAQPTLTRAIQLAEKSYGKSNFEVANIRNNLGVLYQAVGQWKQAETIHRQILEVLESNLGPSHPDVARSLNNLAMVLDRQERVEEAEPLYRRALAIREERLGESHPTTIIGVDALANFLSAQGRFEESEMLLTRGLDARRAQLGEKHPLTAYSMMALASLRHRQGRLEESERLYRQALDLRSEVLPATHPDIGFSWNGLAMTSAAQEKWGPSLESFHAARQSYRRFVSGVLQGLSEQEQLTFLKVADERNFHAALGIAFRTSDPQVDALTAEWVVNGKALGQEALAQRSLLERDSADKLLTSLIDRLRMLRRQLASTLYSTSDSKGTGQAQSTGLIEQEQELSRELAARSGVSAISNNWSTLQEIRERIPQSGTLVEVVQVAKTNYVKDMPVDGEDRYGAWVIPPAGRGDVQFIDLGLASEINAEIRSVREEIQKSITAIKETGDAEAEIAIRPALGRLSQRILHPLVSHLGDRETIWLSPDSLMWIVPWCALPLDDGRYAVEQFDIRYLVSGRNLLPGKSVEAGSRAILMADPNYDLDPEGVRAAAQKLYGKNSPVSAGRGSMPTGDSKLGKAVRLPGTRAEAEAVKPLLAEMTGTEPYLYSDGYAQEVVFKGLRGPRVLVMSTHGFFQGDQGAIREQAQQGAVINPLLRCGLLLTGCNKPVQGALGVEDGILTGLEIVGTDLRGTELVVLSACETGLGEINNGEGVSGLRQAFQLAGARTVISTLWSIPDRETSRLMVGYFQKLAESKDRSGSLREAQRAVMSARRDRFGAAHPFYWAAFTVTGE